MSYRGEHSDLHRPHRLLHEAHRQQILEASHSADLLTAVDVHGEHRLGLHRTTWSDYWSNCLAGADQTLRGQIEALGSARACYIHSGFEIEQAATYCYRYFQLLRTALELGRGDARDPQLLQAVLGLEVVAVHWADRGTPSAAAVLNLRHPAYLLAKLRQPWAYEDPKFLPLVTLAPGGGRFYHYRQLRLDRQSGLALLLYPADDLDQRADSFACLDALAAALAFKPDPRAQQRAARITDLVVALFLARCAKQLREAPKPELSIADIGGGTGILTSTICKELVTRNQDLLGARKLSWTIVDLQLANPSRHTHSPELRQRLSCVQYEPRDYQAWAMEEAGEPGPRCRRFDLVLLCRVLNNLSTFSIESTADPHEVRQLAGRHAQPKPENAHLLHQCLASPAPAPEQLLASNGRLRLRGGTTFRQLSLTDYFQALHLLQHPADASSAGTSTAWFPLRRFNPDALRLPDGSSLLTALASLGGLILIEDVDLTSKGLRDHLETFKLEELVASDATDRRRMQTAQLLCVSPRRLAPALPGRRIW